MLDLQRKSRRLKFRRRRRRRWEDEDEPRCRDTSESEGRDRRNIDGDGEGEAEADELRVCILRPCEDENRALEPVARIRRPDGDDADAASDRAADWSGHREQSRPSEN